MIWGLLLVLLGMNFSVIGLSSLLIDLPIKENGDIFISINAEAV